MIRQIDEINLPLEYDNRIEDFEKYITEYFDEVPTNKQGKEERKSVALEMRDALIFFLLLLRVQIENNALDYDYALNTLRLEMKCVIEPYTALDGYMTSYINSESQEILDSTLNGLDRAAYMLSEDRATVTAVNEASIVVNYKELQDAIDKGYTRKKWVSQKDGRVRPTHTVADGQIKGIDEYFIVGGVAMMIPHDPECVDMQEIANCRCCVKYLK